MPQGQVAASFKVLQYICFYPKMHRTKKTLKKKTDQTRRVNNIMAVLDMPAIFDMLKTSFLHFSSRKSPLEWGWHTVDGQNGAPNNTLNIPLVADTRSNHPNDLGKISRINLDLASTAST